MKTNLNGKPGSSLNKVDVRQHGKERDGATQTKMKGERQIEQKGKGQENNKVMVLVTLLKY